MSIFKISLFNLQSRFCWAPSPSVASLSGQERLLEKRVAPSVARRREWNPQWPGETVGKRVAPSVARRREWHPQWPGETVGKESGTLSGLEKRMAPSVPWRDCWKKEWHPQWPGETVGKKSGTLSGLERLLEERVAPSGTLSGPERLLEKEWHPQWPGETVESRGSAPSMTKTHYYTYEVKQNNHVISLLNTLCTYQRVAAVSLKLFRAS